MDATESIKELLGEVNSRNTHLKEYEKMTIEQLSNELQSALKFEQDMIKKIEALEKNGIQEDMVRYAKVVCSNVTQREISTIQDVYFDKIDNNYLKKNN